MCQSSPLVSNRQVAMVELLLVVLKIDALLVQVSDIRGNV